MRDFQSHLRRIEDMRRERIVSWSESLQRWCVCDGIAKILATAATREEAEALKTQQLQAQQLSLL
jgi:hypothetical protein